MINLESILKSRDITLLTKVHSCGGGVGVLLSVAMCALLIAVASLLVGHGLQAYRLQ